MRQFLVRGLPNFANVEKVESPSIEDFLRGYHCIVKSAFLTKYRPEFACDLQGKIRHVLLYLRCTEENVAEIQHWCNDGNGGTVVTLGENGKIKTAGSWHFHPSPGGWYRVNACMHPDYNIVLKAVRLKAEIEKQLEEQAELKHEQEEKELQHVLSVAIGKHGRDKILSILSAEKVHYSVNDAEIQQGDTVMCIDDSHSFGALVYGGLYTACKMWHGGLGVITSNKTEYSLDRFTSVKWLGQTPIHLI